MYRLGRISPTQKVSPWLYCGFCINQYCCCLVTVAVCLCNVQWDWLLWSFSSSALILIYCLPSFQVVLKGDARKLNLHGVSKPTNESKELISQQK